MVKKTTSVKRPPSVTVFFKDDPAMLKQLVADAKRIGISASALAKLALDVGYPVVRDNFKQLVDLPSK